jgi:methyl halide transferase
LILYFEHSENTSRESKTIIQAEVKLIFCLPSPLKTSPTMSTPNDQPTDARARLRDHFTGAELSAHPSKWDDLWNEGFVPWDRGFPSPALVDLLSERGDLFPTKQGRKKALVPGCGKGYDVLLLSSWGYDAYGLDVSEKALEAARQTQREAAGQDIYKTKKGAQKGNVTWLSGDFFGNDFLKDVDGESNFDLIYDYTVCIRYQSAGGSNTRQFLSALPPSLRPNWSKRYGELLAPDGLVVCLEFPTYKEPSSGGPPWALPPKIYAAHLPRPGKELPYAEDGELVESEIGEPSKNGLRRIAHFQPKRTHEIGYSKDGKVTDWISVWAHPDS